MLTPGIKNIELSDNRYPFMAKEERNYGQKGGDEMKVIEYNDLRAVNVGSQAHDSSRAKKQEELSHAQIDSVK